MKIMVETLIKAPVAIVWDAYTTPDDITPWNAAQHMIAYSFGDRACAVEFFSSTNGATVRIAFDAETENSVEQQRQGWQAIHNSFAKHVEARQ